MSTRRDRGGYGLRMLRVTFLVWAVVVYAAYWARYLPGLR